MIGSRSLSGVGLAAFVVAVSAVLLGVGLDSSASFSDSVRLGRNELVAGTVDLSLGSSATPVVVENLAPGDESVLALDLRNEGTLPMVVSAAIAQNGEAEGGAEADAAADAELDVRYWMSETACQDGPDFELGQQGRLAPGEGSTFCFVVGLPLSAPNSAQGQTRYFTIILTGVQDVTEAPNPTE